ncbi:hypothetical protein VNO78_33202 [Psophocarpus tetragonolobus]|uniref:Uncharacterized protein n=1 Tax=Psophocarpus tetragonolobus TaxID=3891 RepID=A0AAN9RQJ6_PSOTE
MKLQVNLLVVLALFSLFSHTYGEIKFCPKSMTFDGLCQLGISGRSCFEEFLSLLGASAMPMKCRCAHNRSVHKHTRTCTCNVVCQT